MGEVESGATNQYAIYSHTPSPSYSKIKGDNMTDEKTTKELMKALIEFLRAKTEESKNDNEFTKRFLLDEIEIKFEEDQSWSKEFEEEWG
tara:strand:- start:1266 stop:1535 length:270 start_codon:yes stop_codon:yes gene_type:complete